MYVSVAYAATSTPGAEKMCVYHGIRILENYSTGHLKSSNADISNFSFRPQSTLTAGKRPGDPAAHPQTPALLSLGVIEILPSCAQ